MTKYVALLRGINVGGNNKLSMKELKILFESLGYHEVVTYINSGNIIFTAKTGTPTGITKKIEQAIEKQFGFYVPVVLRDSKSIKNLCKKIPATLTNDTEQRTDVLFLWEKYDSKETLKLIKQNSDVDNLTYFSGAIVWNLKRQDYIKSKMNKFIGTEVYKNMTARNINTVRKLKELMS